MEKQLDSGLSKERLNRLTAAIRRDVESERYDGGVVLVARHGVVGVQEAIGFAERATGRPCRLDDVFNLMSITKTFTDAVLLAQIERGELSLVTRVADIIPEFTGSFKEQATIFHLLTHTAGSPPIFFPVEESLMGNHQAVFEASCRLGLSSIPGQKVEYSCTWGHVILGEVIRRVDGGQRPLSDIFQAELFGPLKMKDTALGRRRDLSARIVPIVGCGPYGQLPGGSVEVFNDIIHEDAEIPAWGCVSTIQDLFHFAEMLRRGGELDGVRLLSPATVELATSIHNESMFNEGLPIFTEYGWAPFPINLGFDLVIRGQTIDSPSAMGSLVSPRTFGKFGAGSTGFWVDPERDVTFIFLSVGLLDEYVNFLRFQRLSDMAMAAVT